ncbi:MAG TPA: PQQ-binding-like beta-propeller repeat protein [Gemmataceae bacterium]|nr:PQQ-binding-like beta-propeller repeat protein [Gemmataceae bacterium]
MKLRWVQPQDVLGTLGGVRFVLLTAWILPGLLLAADWPQFLGPHRDSRSSETGLLATWPKNGPPLVWQRPIGAGFSGAAVAGNRLVVFHRVGDKEVVACLDAATGQEQWQFAYSTAYHDDFGKGEGPRATPLIAGDRVYTLGAEGRLLGLELASGKKIWERALNTDYQAPKGFFGVATSPVLEGNVLLVNVGGRHAGIVALDKDTGKEAWRATEHEASYASPVVATIHGKRRAIFFTREGIVLLDPRTGQVVYSKHWRARMHASVNAASPVVTDDLVFFSACYGTGALLLQVGTDGIHEVWTSGSAMSNHYDTCIQNNGYLYGFDGRQEEGAKLRCIELKTGKVRWTDDHPGCGSMILAEGNLIILTENGELLLVEANPVAYKEKARAQVLTAPCRSPIALADGRLYGRDTTKLACWNLKRQ